MRLVWTDKARSDLVRLFEFLAPVNRGAAIRTMRALNAGARKLRDHPRLGERLDGFDSAEVRRIFIGDYELRYQMTGDAVIIVRLWHTRENR